MSQETKSNTMIGTMAPVLPRQSAQASVAGPTIGMRPQSAPPGGGRAAGDPDIFVGQELCGYVIRRKLAEGGMGVVYEGMHGKIGRLGAIKVLKL
jgi:hypothetical protein